SGLLSQATCGPSRAGGTRSNEAPGSSLRPRAVRAGQAELGPMKLGTRGSALALAQARAVAARLRALGADVEIVPMRTEGDRLLEARLATVGGKGLFVREIEEALLEAPSTSRSTASRTCRPSSRRGSRSRRTPNARTRVT